MSYTKFNKPHLHTLILDNPGLGGLGLWSVCLGCGRYYDRNMKELSKEDMDNLSADYHGSARGFLGRISMSGSPIFNSPDIEARR